MFRRRPFPSLRSAALVAGLISVTVAGCASSTTADTSEATATTTGAVPTEEPATDRAATADEVTIALSGDTASASAESVTVDGTTVTISDAGTYRISGTLTDGSVVVDTSAAETVWLVLDGVDITSSTGSPLAILAGEDVVVVLEDGSENRLTDPETYQFADAQADEPDAALFSAADLTIRGTGSLVVDARYADGITSRDSLTIEGGTIVVDATDDAIRGKDEIVVTGGAITATAGGDGLQADNDEDATRGTITVAGGTIEITAGADGLDAVTGVTVTGGTVTVEAADDAVNGGTTVAIDGGAMALAAGDDAVHADTSISITAGDLVVSDAAEGIESTDITIDGGTIEVHSSDDAINIAGGTDGSGRQGGPGGGQDSFAAATGGLTINGGTLVVVTQGDGLDSNGSISMTGGTVVVNGPTSDGNAALDVDGTFAVSGGTLVAVGSSRMAESPDASSSQPSVVLDISSTQPSGTVIQVVAPDGTVVVTFESATAFDSFVLSTPALAAGVTYEILAGGQGAGSAVGGLFEASAAEGTSLGTATAG